VIPAAVACPPRGELPSFRHGGLRSSVVSLLDRVSPGAIACCVCACRLMRCAQFCIRRAAIWGVPPGAVGTEDVSVHILPFCL
jgi:hypothetical protein